MEKSITPKQILILVLGFVLCLFSMFIGNGFNPVFAVVVLFTPAVTVAALGTYIAYSLIHCAVMWVGMQMTTGSIIFQLVMCAAGYIPLIFLPLLARLCTKKFSEVKGWKAYLLGFGTTFLMATFYWWASNTICYTQMCGTIPSWKYYDLSVAGYITCLVAGLKFYGLSLCASLPAYLILALFHPAFQPVQLVYGRSNKQEG